MSRPRSGNAVAYNATMVRNDRPTPLLVVDAAPLPRAALAEAAAAGTRRRRGFTGLLARRADGVACKDDVKRAW
jgi:hypothetical protein